MKKYIYLFCAALLCGCASFGMFNKDLTQLSGSRIEEAFSALGYPDGSYPVGNQLIYVWGTSGTAVIPTTSYSNVYGNVGMTPYYGNITTYQNSVVSANCTIKIATENGMIRGYDYNGNMLGCERYINALHRYMRNKQE